MSRFAERLHARDRHEREQLREALDGLVTSVGGGQAVSQPAPDDAHETSAALGAVLAYYHLNRPYAVADRTCAEAGGSETQTIETLLDRTLHPYGIMRRPVRLTEDWHRDAVGAMVGRLVDGRVVALLPRGTSGYCYVDPETGRHVPIASRNAHLVREEAYCLYRPLPLRALGMRDIATFCVRALDLWDMGHVMLVSMAATALGMLPAWANHVVFDKVIPSGSVHVVLPFTVLLIGVGVSQALVGLSRSLVMARIGTKLNIQLQAAIMARVLLLSPHYFRAHQPGELAQRAMAVTSLAQTMADLVFSTGLSSILSLAYVAQIAAYAPVLAIPALVVTVLNAAVTICATLANACYNKAQLEQRARLSGTFESLLAGIQKIKLAGAERRAFVRWEQDFRPVARLTYDRPFALKASPVLGCVIGLMGTMVIYVLASTSGVTVADYMAFNAAYGMVTGAVLALSNVVTSASDIKPTLDLVAPLLDCQPEVAPMAEQVDSLSGAIELTGVRFAYNENGPTVLDDLSLRIESGDYVAVVGRTGCGKSTLVRLLLGFERPQRGAIYYDGHDLASLDVRSLRRHIGVVLQSERLVSGTIYANIALGTPRLTMEEAWEAARMAGVADDIDAMPMGMYTHVTDGSGGISGGQRQRILIARAVASHPRVLILDEATSALDNVTQQQVALALDGLDCTRIVVAHRLSTIRTCNRILMLEDGRIVEDGTYEELMAAGGAFADLVKRQRLA